MAGGGRAGACPSPPLLRLPAPPRHRADPPPDPASGEPSTSGEDHLYRPRNVLVTGGAGFIASHMVLRLLRRHPEYRVVVYDKMEYCSSLRNLRAVEAHPNFRLVEGDIRDSGVLRQVLAAEAIDTVLHFAAETHVDNSFGNSLAFTLNNVYGTHVLLEACRCAGTVRRFLNVSTDEVYGEQSFGREKGDCELSKLEPTNPYSAAKAGAEMMVKAYVKSYGLPCITTRSNNVYGPHQFPEKVVPKFVMLASGGHKLPVHGTGLVTRSYLYVEDVAEAFDIILHRGVTGETYNVGSERERSVLDVARDICNCLGKDFDALVEHVDDRRFNDRRYHIDDAKLRALGWEESTPWRDGLAKTIQWYLEHGHAGHWDEEDVRAAMLPHPILTTRTREPGPFSPRSSFEEARG